MIHLLNATQSPRQPDPETHGGKLSCLDSAPAHGNAGHLPNLWLLPSPLSLSSQLAWPFSFAQLWCIKSQADQRATFCWDSCYTNPQSYLWFWAPTPPELNSESKSAAASLQGRHGKRTNQRSEGILFWWLFQFDMEIMTTSVWRLPWWSSGLDSMLPVQGAWVQSLIGELEIPQAASCSQKPKQKTTGVLTWEEDGLRS